MCQTIAAQYKHRIIFLCLVVAMLVAMLPLGALAQAPAPSGPAGTLTSATGTVTVQRGASTTAAGPGMTVNVGDRIVTGPGGHATIVLNDQSKLDLSESSNLVIDSHTVASPSSGASTRLSLFGGSLRSFVNASGGAPPNFEVHTPNAVAAARGTSYDTSFSEGATRPTFGECHRFTDVTVFDGVVAVTNPNATGASETRVPAGYESTVPCNLSPLAAGPIGVSGAGGNPGGFGGVPPPACPVCPACSSPK
ncbi:MAG TPA: FecR family protein [Candidatus Binataceae bacterium]|nr:FecR family protein [Candidatus Binataceae bacterium]